MRSPGRVVIRVAATVVAALAAATGAGAQQAVIRAPEAGAVIPWWRPTAIIEVPDSLPHTRRDLRVVIDDSDVTEFAAWQGHTLRVTSPLPLAEGRHAVELRQLAADAGTRVIARVEFTTKPPRRRASVDARMSDASGVEAGHALAETATLAPHADGSLKTSGSSTSFDATWNQPIPFETSNVFVESAVALPPVASRIAFTLADDTERRFALHFTRRWVAASWSRQLWANRWNVSLWVECRWQRNRDLVAGTSGSGGQGLVRLAWNPEWTWSR